MGNVKKRNICTMFLVSIIPRLIVESIYLLVECVIKHLGAADTTCVTSHDTTIDLAGGRGVARH